MLSISRYDENQVSHDLLHSIPDICGILKGQKAIGNYNKSVKTRSYWVFWSLLFLLYSSNGTQKSVEDWNSLLYQMQMFIINTKMYTGNCNANR